MKGSSYLVVLLQMTRPNAVVRGDADDDSVASTISNGLGARAAVGLRYTAAAQLAKRNMARNKRRTMVRATTLPQSAGRTGAGDM